MRDSEFFQDVVSSIQSNINVETLLASLNNTLSSVTSEQKLDFLKMRNEQGLSLLEISAYQSPKYLLIILHGKWLQSLEAQDLNSIFNMKGHGGYTILEQAAKTSPSHIKAILNSNAFVNMGPYALESLIAKNKYGISFVEYALKHESSAFIKAVLSAKAVQNMTTSALSELFALKDSDNLDLLVSAVGSSVEHLKAVLNKELLQKLPAEDLRNLLLKEYVDGNNLFAFTALTQSLMKFNILLDRYNELSLSAENILKLFINQNDDGKTLIEIVVSKGAEYISAVFNHDIISSRLNPAQKLEILSVYSEGGEPILISALNKSHNHIEAIIKSDTSVSLSPEEILEVLSIKDQVGNTFLEVLHAKGSDSDISLLQDSDIFHSLNYELQSQILEQIGIHYDD